MLYLTGENDWMLSALVWTRVNFGGKVIYPVTILQLQASTLSQNDYASECFLVYICLFAPVKLFYCIIANMMPGDFLSAIKQ